MKLAFVITRARLGQPQIAPRGRGRSAWASIARFTLILPVMAVLIQGSSPPQTPQATEVRNGLSRNLLPLTFEMAPGIAESSVRTEAEAQFSARTSNGVLLFTPQGVEVAPSGNASPVQVRFLGSNPDLIIEGASPLPGKVNYLLGNDPTRWRTNVATYAEARYEQLYPGVTLSYSGSATALKGTYLLQPHADPGLMQASKIVANTFFPGCQ